MSILGALRGNTKRTLAVTLDSAVSGAVLVQKDEHQDLGSLLVLVAGSSEDLLSKAGRAFVGGVMDDRVLHGSCSESTAGNCRSSKGRQGSREWQKSDTGN
jgi:hypothetical protein